MRPTRYILPVLLFLAGCSASTQPVQVDPWGPFRSICTIKVTSGTGRWAGSGTLIGKSGTKGLILSCRHVCPRVGMKVQLVWRTLPSSTDGEVVSVGRGAGFVGDLALIVAEVPADMKPVQVARFDPKNGPWIAGGYRDDKLYIAPSEGARPTDGGLIEFDQPYVQGMSGGPVFDANKKVVAVAVGSNTQVAIAADGEQLHDMIAEFSLNPTKFEVPK